MKKHVIPVILLIFAGSIPLFAQQTQPEQQQSPPQNISKSLGLYVFPNEGQDQATQQNDEAACYNWAMQQSGVDPINLQPAEVQEVPQMGAAGAVGGAARGAAAGAAIGAIAGDAGKGAAIGAAAGGMGGLRAGRRATAQGQQQAQAQAQQQTQQQLDEFKKAFSVCMEAKEYTIK